MDLSGKLQTGDFVVLAEIMPPKGTAVEPMMAAAAQLSGHVDALVVTDMSGAMMRMSALGAAALLQKNATDTVLEMGCRDRNRLALQADLLAASAHGITNLLVGKAEDLARGDHHQAKPVFDLQPLDLLDAVRSLQQGRDMAGGELSGSPRFLVGAAVGDVFLPRALPAEVDEIHRMADRGAAYFVTPPLFDMESIRPLLQKVKGEGLKIIPTVLLLKSVGMARYIAAHIDRIRIPPEVIERIQNAEDAAQECIRIAAQTISRLREEGFSGALLSMLGWEARVQEVVGTEETAFGGGTAATHRERARKEEAMSKRKRILVVDDEPDFVSVVRTNLEKAGFTVETAFDGMEALRKIEKDPPDAIVLDVMMPEKDGYSVCATLKADKRFSGIPVLLLTAVAEHVTSTRYTHYDGMVMEADDYLAKPASAEQIIDRLNRLL